MKKILLLLSSLAMLLGGCASKNTSEEQSKEQDLKVIKVASQMESVADILEIANKEAEKEGYTIEMVRVNDNVQYNKLLNDKEVDANLAQHEPFMQDFNEAYKGNLVIAQPVYDAKVGYYSKEYKTIEDIPNDKKVAIPNDASNQGRALAILDEKGLIKLKDGVSFEGTVKDIVENPKNFEFKEIDLVNLASAYDEADMALVYNYPTYLKKINLTPEDAILLEEPNDNHFAISLVAREDNVDSEAIQVLKKAVASDGVRDYLENEENSVSLIPSF
ncbi:MetQ/NlpA family ABC transporter substrate-binding protein [Vagococcus xieshaowenii]|uniref:Lipoprotein n=1 Tax=Vagococcus xieshaowenii TaxID=2562451 RepID=A0AAJ5EFI4_9ENTE|nr:MetQ/NlpA family ABC transporter substrate-binding protein [Vagococcus xieshaowenii]QCA29031.1 hypothetical protein E4Z98_06785 [Vagococcus xieshaowenii]TFZ40993.1 hypothetical protein E4031_06310 [Vagococcus xieshaowenii]